MENQSNVDNQNTHQVSQIPPNQPMAVNGKPKMNYWLILTIILILLLSLGGLYFYNSQNTQQFTTTELTPSPTVKKRLPSIQPNNRIQPVNRIAILKDGGLALINPDGTGLTQVYIPDNSNGPQAGGIIWSPDGKKIAFTGTTILKRNVGNNETETIGTSRSLIVLQLDTKKTDVLIKEIGRATFYSWSPDGNHIVLNEDGTLKIMGVATKTINEIANDAYLSPTSNLQGEVVDYTPSRVVWTVENKIFYLQRVDQNTSLGEKRLAVIEHDGSKKILVPDKDISFYGAFSVSRDGKKIAYTENRKGHSESIGIWIVNADGTNNRQLTKDTIPVSGKWSPDGKYLFGTGGLGGVFLIDTSTGQISNLPSGILGGWSPDGKQIAYTKNKPNVLKGGEIRVYDINTKKDIKISDSFSSVWVIAWSPI